MSDGISDAYAGVITTRSGSLAQALADEPCDWCGAKPIREVLDGDSLCQACCDKWCLAEQTS